MRAGRLIVEGARALARNKTVQTAAATVAANAAAKAGPSARGRYDSWRDRRIHRDRAIKLARQVRGRYSEDTIIAGHPHYVVWKDGRPVEAFPPVEDLGGRPELEDFEAALAHEPPPLKPPRRGLRRGR
jgi:hypothetical protein